MPTSRISISGLFSGAGLALLALVMLAPLLYFPFARDHGMYMVVAETMSRGGMPYADAWDLKTPGIFFVFRTALALFGRVMWGVRVLELVSLAATALLLARTGRRLFPELPAAGPVGAAWFLLFCGHNLNYWHTAQAESFLMLPLALGIHFAIGALQAGEKRRGLARAVMAGLCTGIVFVFKFPNILPLACCLPLLLPAQEKGKGLPRLPLLAWFAAGALLAPALAGAWFALGGAWGPMVETLFVFAPRYAGITASSGLLAHAVVVFGGFFLPGAGLTLVKWLALVGLAVCRQSPRISGRYVLPLWFLLSLLVIFIQGKFFLYHYLPLYMPLGLLAGTTAATLASAISARVKGGEQARRRSGAILLATLLALPFLLDQGTIRHHWRDARAGIDHYRDGTDFSLAADLEMADYLKQNTGPDDPVFIWGYETLVYFLAERRPASRFITHQPLASRWQMPGWREELMTDLERQRPPRILVMRRDAMPAVTGSTLDSAALLAEYPELQRFIQRHYRLETTIEDFMVYGPLPGGAFDDQH